MGCPAYIPHGNCLGFFYLIWVEIVPRMSVAGRGLELAKSPCMEVPAPSCCIHTVSAPATGTRWGWALIPSGCEEADLPPWLMGLEP